MFVKNNLGDIERGANILSGRFILTLTLNNAENAV